MILKKLGDEYKLYSHDSCIATTHESPYKKLSLKNCQAIENGYDLDELAKDACNITDPLRLDSQKYKQDPYFRIGFNKGFQKALEILSDKKFSEEELDKAFELGKHVEREDCNENYLHYKQSLQQTEWDVEIVEVRQRRHLSIADWVSEDENGEFPMSINGGFSYRYIPKLDVEGCLILKRK